MSTDTTATDTTPATVTAEKHQRTETNTSGNMPTIATREFSLNEAAIATLMENMSNLYQDPRIGTLREYSSNAADAHAAINNPNPIEITLPTSITPTLTITDHGIGMSMDELLNVYTSYGMSQKQNDLNQTGNFGYGSKSAFSLSDQFTVTSTKNGTTNTALIYKQTNGIPTLEIINQTHTNNPSGTTITIPINNEHMTGWHKTANHVFQGWETGTVTIDGTPHTSPYDNALPIGNYYLSNAHKENTGIPSAYAYKHTIIIGNIAYQTTKNTKDLPLTNTLLTYGTLKLPIASTDFTPSRDDIQFTNFTLTNITNASIHTLQTLTNTLNNTDPTTLTPQQIKYYAHIYHTINQTTKNTNYLINHSRHSNIDTNNPHVKKEIEALQNFLNTTTFFNIPNPETTTPDRQWEYAPDRHGNYRLTLTNNNDNYRDPKNILTILAKDHNPLHILHLTTNKTPTGISNYLKTITPNNTNLTIIAFHNPETINNLTNTLKNTITTITEEQIKTHHKNTLHTRRLNQANNTQTQNNQTQNNTYQTIQLNADNTTSYSYTPIPHLTTNNLTTPNDLTTNPQNYAYIPYTGTPTTKTFNETIKPTLKYLRLTNYSIFNHIKIIILKGRKAQQKFTQNHPNIPTWEQAYGQILTQHLTQTTPDQNLQKTLATYNDLTHKLNPQQLTDTTFAHHLTQARNTTPHFTTTPYNNTHTTITEFTNAYITTLPTNQQQQLTQQIHNLLNPYPQYLTPLKQGLHRLDPTYQHTLLNAIHTQTQNTN